MPSIENLYKFDFRFPGIEIKSELIVLHAYLTQMEAGIQSVGATYIDQEMKNYKNAEYYEYQHIYHIAEEEMPRIIRIPFVVTIGALFENSVIRLLDYGKDKEQKALALKDLNGKKPISTYNKYMKHILGWDFQFNNQCMQDMHRITTVRNYVAHANGNISQLSKEKKAELQKISSQVVGLTIDHDVIDVTDKYLLNALETVDTALKKLMVYMETRYDFHF